jgi:hypothetical protein
MTVRELWTGIKRSVGAALDRMQLGVVIVAGLAAVVIAFGALGLAMLDGPSAPDDLGLGRPPGSVAERDPASGTDGPGVAGAGGDSLSDGLTTDGAGGGGSGGDAPSSGAGGTSDDTRAGAGAPSPAGGSGSPVGTPPTTAPTTTSASVPRTTAPTAPATTAAPPSTPTTAPPHEPGLVGGLLDLLGLG